MLYHLTCTPHSYGCSLVEQKIDQLSEMTAELDRKLLKIWEECRVASTVGGDEAEKDGMDNADT